MPIELRGRIDANNAALLEKEILEKLEGQQGAPVIFDAAGLEYISSAGLRALLHIRKSHPDMKITGVSSEIYGILDMSGFTEMIRVEKACRRVSVEGCEEIGRGANGVIYRIDRENVVKVYKNTDALADIQHEREVAKLALILGIPTAISYEVVRVGDRYGSVFELMNARSFSSILAAEPEKLDWCVGEYVALLKRIHGTLVPPGRLPDGKERALSRARFLQDYLPEAAGRKLLALVEAVPHDDHMIHGDYHTKNLELQNDEVLIIDMETLSVGHPVFELASIYNAFLGYSELDHEVIKAFQGFDYETGVKFWRKALAAYLGTNNERALRAVEDKARILGYARMIRRSIRRKGLETESGRARIAFWKERLLELLEKEDTLVFARNELEIEAADENLEEVQDFVQEQLDAAGCSPKAQMQLSVAVEEIFINIAHYAYAPGTGKARVRVQASDKPSAVTITFTDRGVPFDPLGKQDPDVALPADERSIGGLGVFLTKKLTDDMSYAYLDGQNILTLTKRL